MVGAAANPLDSPNLIVEEGIKPAWHGQGRFLAAYAELPLIVSSPSEYLLCSEAVAAYRLALPKYDAELVAANDILDNVDLL